ncbi:hypothetical protein [Winogradskyella sp.]|uniref:hypothetical protein n=1 Tax=Winogradskyella sp. TaxID=1883156 RepID=UPI0025D5A3BC|nr:hypothetical protein [Winogradskyella sp.]
MKTKQFITGILSFLTIYCFTLAFTGCSSDDDGDGDGQTTVAYRVTEIISTETSGSDVYEDKELYNYIDERLIEVIDLDKENGIWEEDRKTVYDYEGDWVYSRRYNKDGDNWVEQNLESSQGIKIVNGKVVETKYSNTFMNYVYKTIFTYNGDDLVRIESFRNDELDEKYVLTYNGGNLQDVIEYEYNDDIEEMYYKHAFSYSGGKLSEKLGLYFENGVWVNNDKDVYLYSGNKVIQIDDYDYDNDSWEFDDSEFFSYNSLGLLESISESGDGWTEEEIYTYEAGIGNYKLIQGDDGWYYYNNYPTAQREAAPNTIPDARKFNINRFLMH